MLILLAHGSRDRQWRDSLASLVQAVGVKMPQEEVRVAFMQFEGPTLREVVEDAARSGENPVRILPLFMASAGHVDKDIKPLVGELVGKYPGTALELLAPVGESDLFPTLIAHIATGPSEPS